MSDQHDPDKIKGPGGLTMRQIHTQIKQSIARDQQAANRNNAHAGKQSRWQRFVRFVWDKRRG